jgi:hypothetical protein
MAKELSNNIIQYSNIAANSMRGDDPRPPISFWNAPLPEDLLTINGNVARFNKSWNKTHTTFYRRRASIKVEMELSDGSTKLYDLGDFLIKAIESDEDTANIQLDDLAKPLMDESAEKVKSGFQWYRNAPINFLVTELLKTVFADKRNGELPRDWVINPVRPKSPSNSPVLSSMGKPPGFTKLSMAYQTGITRALVKANVDGQGEKLYLGIDDKLWKFDSVSEIYEILGAVESVYSESYLIQKLWASPDEKTVYGIAHPEEKLITTETPNSKSDSQYKFSCPVSTEFIIFKYDLLGISILFDSRKNTTTARSMPYKLFTGQYHVVPPHFVGLVTSFDDYWTANRRTQQDILPPSLKNFFYSNENIKQYSTGIRLSNNTGSGERVIIKKTLKDTNGQFLGIQYGYPSYVENLSIPFAQSVGIAVNRNLGVLMPSWTYEKPSKADEDISFWFGLQKYYEPDPPYGNESQWLQRWGINFGFSCRSRIIISPLSSYDSLTRKPGPLIDKQGNVLPLSPRQFIIQTFGSQKMWMYGPKRPGLSAPFESVDLKLYKNEVFDGICQSANYDFDLNTECSNLPFEDLISRKFDTGYMSLYDEGVMPYYYQSWATAHWEDAAWPWIKYTSGQIGSTCFLPNYGNKGGIFICTFSKAVDDNLKIDDPDRRIITQWDINLNKSSNRDQVEPVPLELSFRYFVFDLETKTFKESPALSSSDGSSKLAVTTANGFTLPFQPTCAIAAENGVDVYIGGMAFNNKNNLGAANYNLSALNYRHRGLLYKLKFNTTLGVYDSKEVCMDSTDDTPTELQILTNSSGSKNLFAAGYHRSRVLDANYSLSNLTRPSYGTPFFLGKYLGVGSWSYPVDNDGKQMRGLKAEGLNLWAVKPSDRNEEVNGSELHKLEFSEGFIFESATQYTNKGDISSVVSGENNLLSNLEILNGAIYGVSSQYYPQPIKKVFSKNYLWKYDTYLSGIIELADFSGMKVWDALDKLTQAFNYLMGFDGDKFFFLPKQLGDEEPDVFIDYDLDRVVKIKKTQDSEVKNIVSAVPYFAQKKEIEWSVVQIPNVQMSMTSNNTIVFNDPGRVKLDVALRIRQDDDLAKSVVLKTVTAGPIPNVIDSWNKSVLRFSFLIYNTVIETKLIKDLASWETEIYLPSLFGESLEDQCTAGDLISLMYTDPDTQETRTLTKLITQIDFMTNIVTIDSAFGLNFPMLTPVTIIRSNAIKDPTSDQIVLKNNSWSDEGVTYFKDGIFTRETDNYTAIVNVGSHNNIGIKNIIRFGTDPTEYYVVEKIMNPLNQIDAWLILRRMDGQPIFFLDSTIQRDDLVKAVVKVYWTPMPPSSVQSDLIEVGGSRIFIGLAVGSTGTFWINAKGSDRIEITSEGLVLDQDSNAKVTAIDLDSVTGYGKQEISIDDNKFIQKDLLQYCAKISLDWNSKPKLAFEISNLIGAINQGGGSYYNIPFISITNTQAKRLFKVRIRSKKLLYNFKDYSVDCYILEHSINTKDLSQTLKCRAVDPY